MNHGIYNILYAPFRIFLSAGLLFSVTLSFSGVSRAADWNINCGDNAALINAIAQSNQTLQNDVISVRYGRPDCNFTFTSANNLTDGPNALPSILSTAQAGSLTILAPMTRFSASTRTIPLRFFHVAVGGDLMLAGLWLAEAGNVNGASVRIDGGAIYNRGRVTINYAFFTRNSGERGGILYNAVGANALLQQVDTISWGPFLQPLNSPPAIFGGALFNSGTLTVRNSWIRENVAVNEGAGIYNDVGGVVEVSQSSLASNRVAGAGSGGGFSNRGTATLTNVSLGNNEAMGGAGMANYGTATLSHVTIAGNSLSASAFLNRGTARVKNSILFGRTGVSCDGVITTRGRNIASDSSCGTAVRNVGYVHIGEMERNPQLTPGHPAVDVTTDCSTYAGQRLLWDQLYSPRQLGKACDLGSTEWVPPVTVQMRTFTAATPDFGLISGGQATGLVMPTLNATTDLPLLNLTSPYVGTNAGGSPLIQSSVSFGQWFTAARTLMTLPTKRWGDWYGMPGYISAMDSILPISIRPQYYSLQMSAYFDIPIEWYSFGQRPRGSPRLSLSAPDDTWVYIDGQLVIDRGGLHTPSADFFDRYLIPGRHRLDVFNARRAAAYYGGLSPSLELSSSVPLVSVPTTPRISHHVALSTVSGSPLFTPNTTGCAWGSGSGYVGKMLFKTEVKNISNTGGAVGMTLSNLQLEIRTLGAGNLVVHPRNLAMSVGGRLDAQRILSYSDGLLAPGETTQVPVAMCVTSSRLYSVVFDAFGTAL